MRRFSAILLLALFGCTLIAPALAAAPESKLPSCCRKDGKHHCSMESMAQGAPAPSGVQIQSSLAKCPYFPAALGSAAAAQTGLVDSGFVIPATAATYDAAVEQGETLLHMSCSRDQQKRGPPSLQS